MWRGYGKSQPSVALVLNTDVHFQVSNAIGAYFTPVAYGNRDSYANSVRKTIKEIELHREQLETVDASALRFAIYESLVANSVGRKHIGFQEENEWRVIHIENKHERGKLIKAVEDIGGRPQSVMKLPLKNYDGDDFFGADVSSLLHHIVIGPTEYPEKLREAFVDILQGKKIKDADKKVIVSDIPWRGW